MAPREDLVSSAVTFLQDPSVASAPVEKRIEFLKSKNLTQEEIEASLARAGGDSAPPTPPPNTPYYPPPANYPARGPPGQRYPYPYNPYGEWQPPPPPEPPRRDWRDWFIMATVVGGASYGLYTLAQRYIKPLIAPPTPPQLEQDKAAIDEQFNKAFALLDTLSSDTAALKEAEEARTQRLDNAITDIETIVAELKAANMRREDDARRMESEIKTMKDSLPRSIDSVRDASERQLKELSTELGSLKALMGNRLGGGSFGPGGQGVPRTQPGTFPGTSASASTSAVGTPSTETAPAPTASRPTPNYTSSASAVPTAASLPAGRPASAAPFASTANKAAIPAWQMAAANKAKEASGPSPAAASHNSNVAIPATNGSSQPDGAEAVAALNAS
ncbi:peroxisomal membrane protein pex14 [Cladophialophora chaetospira]|uniref:Peroxisomal membrane protein PEX14 n=1 Tax=Cladophialophora chaetospira TaxID=386627 RepID=A0AA39CK18_9EURO|nr:peroxisomal membrane protein pex14 [Cladophialophora chaetospira]